MYKLYCFSTKKQARIAIKNSTKRKKKYNAHMKKFPWQTLIDWYEINGRHSLPWRDYDCEQNDLSYRVWLSEILLQQTQAERVIGYFERILEKFPDIFVLSRSDYDTFFPYYQGMGYYSRARNILKTAKIVANEYNGHFPTEKKLLKNLPGIGEYTSSAILAFGYGEAFLAWDTNLEKVFSRYYFGTSEQKLSESEKEDIENDFREFVGKYEKFAQKNTVRAINNGLMDFSRSMDLKNPENIDWGTYIFEESEFYKTRGKLEENTTKKAENFPIPDAKIVAILHENHKIYFSEKSEKYECFILSPSLDRNTREYVKNYFREKFSLEVSVRPVHKKWLSKNGEPFIAVNVQIQTGNHNFARFEKTEVKKYLEKIFEN